MSSFGPLAVKHLGQRHGLGARLGEALPPLALAGRRLLTLAGASELSHEGGLFELTVRAEHLPDKDGGRRVVKEGVGTVGGDQRNPKALKKPKARLLHDEITCEAASRLHDDRPDAIACDATNIAAKPGRWSTGSLPFTASSLNSAISS